MNKMIVVVFDSEKSVYEGLSAMGELHQEGSISLYSTAVLAKDEQGEVQIKQAAEKGPVGTAVGLATGSLVGLLAGPAGLLVGASIGALSGLLYDVNDSGVDIAFIDDVSNALSNGKYAVLAEIDELWMAPIDARMENLGGLVFRRLRSEVIEDQLIREAEAFDMEMKSLEAELAEASDEAKAAINKQIESTRIKLEAINQQAKEKFDNTAAEGKVKVQALEQQMQNASDQRKAKMVQRKAELEAEYTVRTEKLEDAWELTKEALSV